MVKAGDLLAQVDPRAFQVALAQAQGTQMQNLAQLENARRTCSATRPCTSRTPSPSSR